MTKLKLRAWVWYALLTIAFLVFFLVCDSSGLVNVVYSIEEHGNGLDITKIVVVIVSWEILKITIKKCIKK